LRQGKYGLWEYILSNIDSYMGYIKKGGYINTHAKPKKYLRRSLMLNARRAQKNALSGYLVILSTWL